MFDLDPQASATSWADRRKTAIPAVVAAQPPRMANAGKPAWVLLNAVPPHGKVGVEATVALHQGGVQVVPLVLHHLVAFSHAVTDGHAAQEYDPRGRAAAEVSALFAWLTKALSLQTRKRTNTQTRKRA